MSRPVNKRVGAFAVPALLLCALLAPSGCANMINAATSSMADNLSAAILNQDDPETVRDGAPAYLLMMDSFVEGSPDNWMMLRSAAELYAAYGIIFVDDPERGRRLTRRSLNYARQALCVVHPGSCSIWDQPFEGFVRALDSVDARHAQPMFTLGLAWLAYVQAHADDWSALADLPKAEAVLLRVQAMDRSFRAAEVEHYLGVLNTLRPPALGGQFDKGRAHYERAIELTGGKDLGVKVDFARYYARTLYDRELHDQLLIEVMEADAAEPGLTLFNTLAQREARAMLASADDYF